MAGPGNRLIVHFMRHAEAIHKMNEETDISIRDPHISPRGIQQCEDFHDDFEGQARYINCILSSPMTRALNTAWYAFQEVINSTNGWGLTVIAMAELQTLDAGPNGQGLDPDKLADRYNGTDCMADGTGLPQGWVNVTSFVPEGWNMKETGRWSAEEVQWRLDSVNNFLIQIGLSDGVGSRMVEVVVVTHGSFLRQLFNDATMEYEDAKLIHCVFDVDGGFMEISKETLDRLRVEEFQARQRELSD